MTPRQAGLALALAHTALVASLGAKLLADRARLPHGWARTLPFDPDLPIRGRYVRLRLEIPLDSAPADVGQWDLRSVRLRVENDRLVGTLDTVSPTMARFDSVNGEVRGSLAAPVAFFIPEHIPDPSVRAAGEELWAEVTVTRRGPPRPIRLAIRRDGALTPLEIR
ncbi:MAG TPA: hypothetical protein VFT84_00455 [Gemmatimonadales bacterium]|nr:hypothetical protein [Gemmatimonadales bacterium]